MSIKFRLTVSFSALFGVLVIALAVLAYLLASKDTYSKLDGELQVATGATAMAAGHEFNEHPTKEAGERDLREVLAEARNAELSKTQILVREQDRIVAYRSAPGSVDLRAIPQSDLTDGGTVSGLRVATRRLDVPKFQAHLDIYAAQPIQPALAGIARLRNILIALVPIGLALAGCLGFLFAAKAMRPLKDFAETIDAVTSSDLTARVDLTNARDEIGRLGSRFNFLLDGLAAALALQRRFMADASHQIKTPVAIALTASQVVNRDPEANLADCRESLHVIENQMLQLRRIVSDMFFLSQADTAALKFEKKEIYFDDAVSEAVRAAKALASAKQQTLKLSNLPEAKCLGDEDLLRQAVLTLLDNAVKFTPEAGNIEVSLNRRDQRWVCSVTDNGIGINLPAQTRIFERFFREKRNGAPGAGLGLAIAKSIAEKHGGTVALVESQPGRTTFIMEIPAVGEQQSGEPLQANSFAVKI